MELLKQLSDPAVWQEYYEYKLNGAHLSARDARFLAEFIGTRSWREVTDRFERGDYRFSLPQKKLINKLGTQKKRVVYSFTPQENTVLKLISYLLYRYDSYNLPCLYSFRRDFGAKRAVNRITAWRGLEGMYCCKLDIKNYFNSIDVELLLPMLKQLMHDDLRLYSFFEQLLVCDECVQDGKVLHEKRGAMAGTPVSPFLANIYLKSLDESFENSGILYARYSDDIIFFAENEARARELYGEICEQLRALKLEVNESKLHFGTVSDGFDYLGIFYRNRKVDVSRATKDKLKGKIKRKARSIYRWKLRKGASDDKAMAVFCRSLNRKLFENSRGTELTWVRWFFPLLSTDTGLRELDTYIQQTLRYIASGRYSKSNYRIRYEQLKNCGYRSLVNEYYKFKSGKPSQTQTVSE